MKSTYRTIPNDDDDDDSDLQRPAAEIEDYGITPSGDTDTSNRSQWDDDCPWSEWYSAENPVKGRLVLFFTILNASYLTLCEL